MSRAWFNGLFLLLCAAGPLAAQDRDQQWKWCSDPDPDLSIGACTRLIQAGQETTDNLARAFTNRGIARIDREELDLAISDFTQAIKVDPTYVHAFLLRGETYDNQEEFEKAIEDYDRAVSLAPRNDTTLRLRGITRLHTGDYQMAVDDLTQSLGLSPTNGTTLFQRARGYFALKQYDKSIEDGTAAVALLNDSIPGAYYNRGIAYLAAKRAEARADFTHYLFLNPDSAKGYSQRGRSYLQGGHNDSALADFSRALELDSTQTEVWYNRGLAYRNLSRRNEALADFSEYLRREPDDLEGLSQRATLYLNSRQFTMAIADYDRYVELDSTDAGIWSSLCLSRVGAGQFAKAETDCNQALELKPDSNDDALDNRGMARLRLGRLPDARADFNAALTTNPRDAYSMFGRGIVKQLQGDAVGGQEDLDSAVKLNSGVTAFMARYGIVPKKPAVSPKGAP